MTGYDFHPEAAVDLDEIWEFIAADNLEAADGVIGDILRAIDVLVRFPHQGYRRSDLTSRPLRFRQARGYLIAYAPDEKPLWVVGNSWAEKPTRNGRDSERPAKAFAADRNPLFRRPGHSRTSQPFAVGVCGFDRCKREDTQDWEQGRRRPTGPAAALLSIIEHDPALAVKAILWRSSSRQRRDRAVAAAVRKGSPVQLHDPDPYWECPVDRRK